MRGPPRIAGCDADCGGIECGGIECGGIECGGIECGGIDCGGIDCGGIDCGGIDCACIGFCEPRGYIGCTLDSFGRGSGAGGGTVLGRDGAVSAGDDIGGGNGADNEAGALRGFEGSDVLSGSCASAAISSRNGLPDTVDGSSSRSGSKALLAATGVRMLL